MKEAISLLRQCAIRPTPQRIAVVQSVLGSNMHPSADEVFCRARRTCPTVSRATVYNTLKHLLAKRMLRTQILREGKVVFDSNVKRHHHFIDEETGVIYDVPWESLVVTGGKGLKGFQVRECQVVLRGRRRKG